MGNNTTRRALAATILGSTLLLASPPASAQNPVPPPSGLLGWWTCDDSADDIGILGLHGTLSGPGGSYEPAHVLSGFRPAAPDGHIAVPDADALDLVTDFTFEGWVRVDALGSGHSYIVNKGSGDHRSTPFTFGIVRADNTFTATSGASMTGIPWGGRPFVTLSDGSLEQVVIANTSVPLGSYVHLAFVVESMNPGFQCRIYMNGGRIGIAWLSRLPFAGTQALQLAGIAGGSGNSLDGVVDELTVYDRVLTAAEIQTIAAAGSAGKEKPNLDDTPPDVTIASPAAGQVLGSRTVNLQTTVVDDSPTAVESIPAGLAAQLPAGGGNATGSVTLAGPDGVQVITVQAVDDAGNAASTSVDIVVDTAAPELSILGPQPGTVSGTSSVQIAVNSDDMTATELTIAGTMQPLPPGNSSVTVDVQLAEGPNSVPISSIDEAGNTTALTLDLTLDSTAPVIEILSPADGALFGPGQDLVPVTVRIDDLTATTVVSSPAGIAGSLPAGGGILSGTATLQEGVNQIAVSVTDAAGARASASVSVNLDSTAPTIDFLAPTSGELLQGTVEVSVDAADLAPGSGVAQVELFAGNALLASAPGASLTVDVDTTALSDGAVSLLAVATDGAGNQGTTSLAVTVDNTPPEIRILTPTAGDPVAETVRFEALVTDDRSGVTEVIQRVEGLAPTTDGSVQLSSPASSVQVEGLEDTVRWPNGPAAFEIQATDLAGNVATAQVEVTVDNVEVAVDAPVLEPRDGATVRGEVCISLESATATELEIRLDGDTLARGWQSPLKARYDTSQRLDAPMEIRGVVSNGPAIAETVHHVQVDNLFVRSVHPSNLKLSTRGKKRGHHKHGRNVWVQLENRRGRLDMAADTLIELRVRGGNSVVAEWFKCQPHARKAWIRFDRGELVAALRGALTTGNYGGGHRLPLGLFINGHEVGTVRLKVNRGHWRR